MDHSVRHSHLHLQSTRSPKPVSKINLVQSPLEAMPSRVLSLRSVVIPTTQSITPTQTVVSNLFTITNRGLIHQSQALTMASTVSLAMAHTC